MDKETLMKAWTYVLLTAAIVLVGCQGQDPGKDYSQVKASANQPYDSVRGGSPVVKPPPAPEGGTERRVCAEPQVTVKDDSGEKVLMFTEGTEKTFEISVRSFSGEDLNIQPAGLTSDFHAARAKFAVDQKSGNLSTYKFTWTPSKLKTAGQPEIQALNFTYANKLSKICGPKGQFALNLLVVPATKGESK